MPISFDPNPATVNGQEEMNQIAREFMRPYSRKYDVHEHEMPWEFVNPMWDRSLGKGGAKLDAGPGDGMVTVCVQTEELCWGDAGLYLRSPSPLLGGSAVAAAGTPEQREKFLAPFRSGKPKWGAMAITEPQAGSDAAAIQTTAVFDESTNEWVLNGTKIFCTAGDGALSYEGGFVVVWATVDKTAGRAGVKSFIVPAGTAGIKVVGCEKKLGIRASDTATLSLENCRIPANYLLGKSEVKKDSGDKGFKGAMATFDASRPIVAAMAVGVGRAALDFVKEELERQGVAIRYDAPPAQQTAIERDVIDMEAELQAARLLTWRAAKMLDRGQRNNLEASQAKAKAGLAVTKITQKAVELLGPLGYSQKLLVEKWMRDAKINDIYEGTQQINQLIVARRILDYSSSVLR
ncbi:MAG: acyl-CoA dehydrogenase [Proteobacteria bacterium]|nr:MAG: acyl-CoA dehydrogenase [Pseudomonadota bacterium]